jgi:hypothetical protein
MCGKKLWRESLWFTVENPRPCNVQHFKSPASLLSDGFAARSHHNVLLDYNKVKYPSNGPAIFDVEVDYSKKTDDLSWSL